MASMTEAKWVAEIVRDAGGKIVGRTRIQKIVYFLESAGLGGGFPFQYKHYGPYSQDLSDAVQTGCVFNMLTEEEAQATWGGFYSIYRSELPQTSEVEQARQTVLSALVDQDAVVLELAATALFLADEKVGDPWGETARRKPEKASDERMAQAKRLYEQLRAISTPRALPLI